jgi:hypothetical protein
MGIRNHLDNLGRSVLEHDLEATMSKSMGSPEDFLKCRDILNRARVPLNQPGAYMSKDTYISLGGSKGAWEARFGNDTVAYVEKK